MCVCEYIRDDDKAASRLAPKGDNGRFSVAQKLVELLKQVAPRVMRAGVIHDPSAVGIAGRVGAIQAAAASAALDARPSSSPWRTARSRCSRCFSIGAVGSPGRGSFETFEQRSDVAFTGWNFYSTMVDFLGECRCVDELIEARVLQLPPLVAVFLEGRDVVADAPSALRASWAAHPASIAGRWGGRRDK
jgi:hypothetical protein